MGTYEAMGCTGSKDLKKKKKKPPRKDEGMAQPAQNPELRASTTAKDAEAAAKNPFVQELWAVPGNGHCADCGRPDPTWASRNLGTLICKPCSGIHRRMGVHLTFVQSLVIDEWEEKYVAHMKEMGNTKVNATYEFLEEKVKEVKPVVVDEAADNDVETMKKLAGYIHSKYVLKNFSEGGSGELVSWDEGVATSSSSVGLSERMGMLMVQGLKAQNLPRMDGPLFKSDPYCIFTLGEQVTRTKTIEQELNPVWSEMVNLNVFALEDELLIEIYDEDLGRPDDYIGKVALQLSSVMDATALQEQKSGETVIAEVNQAIDGSGEKGVGTLQLKLLYTSLQ